MSWSESVESAERLGRMFQDFANVSAKFGEVANLENHMSELVVSVTRHKAEVEKAKMDVKKAREKADQIIVEANDKSISIIEQGEATAADLIARARIAAEEFAAPAEARQKSAAAAADVARCKFDMLQGQIADANTELAKTEERLKLARDKVAAILNG